MMPLYILICELDWEELLGEPVDLGSEQYARLVQQRGHSTDCRSNPQLGSWLPEVLKMLTLLMVVSVGRYFLDFVEWCLLDVVQPDGNNPKSVVVLDNAFIHHLETVVDLIEAAEALVWFFTTLQPWSQSHWGAFSQLKLYLREYEQSYQGSSEPRVLISSVFASVTPQQCQNYIRHAGYME